jgi:autotransporter-associated beta strand protein
LVKPAQLPRLYCAVFKPFFAAIILVALFVSVESARAVGTTWTGGGTDDNWSTAANWNTALVSGTSLIYNSSGNAQLTSNDDQPAGTYTIAGITFSAGSGAYNLTGNSINLTGGITNNATAAETVSLPMVLTTAGQTLTATGTDLVINGNISSSGAFGITVATNSASHVVFLGGSDSYTGATSVNSGGVLDVTGTINGGGTITDGGTLNLESAGAINGSTISVSAGHVLNETVVNAITGASNFNGNNIQGTANLTVANNFTGAVIVTQGGTLLLGDANAIASSSGLNLGSGGHAATLELRNDSSTVFNGPTTTMAGNGSSAVVTINVDHTSTGFGQTLTLGAISTNASGFTVTNGDNYNLATGIITEAATSGNGFSLTNNMTNGVTTVGGITLPNGTELTNFLGTSVSGTTSVGTMTEGGGSQAAVFVNTAGAVVFTSTNNNYAGLTAIQGGSLSVALINSVSTNATLGTVHYTTSSLGVPGNITTGAILLGYGATTGTLVDTGVGEITDRVITLSGSSGGATLDQSGASGKLQFTSNVTSVVTAGAGRTLTLQGSTAGTAQISGTISDPLASTSGTVSSTASSGATSISITNASNLFAVGVTISGNASIPAGTTVTAISGNTVTLSQALTGSIASTTALTVTGVTSPTNVTKAGTGAWALSAANTYTGSTAVQAGTLIVSGSLSGSSVVTVGASSSAAALALSGGLINLSATTTLGSNGTLSGYGSLGSLVVSGGSVNVSGTGNGVADLAISSGSFAAASTFNITLGVPDTVSASDAITNSHGLGLAVSGTLTLPVGMTFNIADDGHGDLGPGYYEIVSAGTLNLLGSTSGFAISGPAADSYSITQSGQDLVLDVVAVPEPGTCALALSSLGALIFVQTFRKRLVRPR